MLTITQRCDRSYSLPSSSGAASIIGLISGLISETAVAGIERTFDVEAPPVLQLN